MIFIEALLSGLVTFAALFLSFENEHENNQLERRLSIKPFFEFNIEILELDSIKIGVHPENISDKFIISPPEMSGEPYKPNYIFNLLIENIGLQPATRISIVEFKYYGMNVEKKYYFNSLKVEEKMNFVFQLKNDLDSYDKFIELKLGYYDLMDHYYEQNIKIDINQKPKVDIIGEAVFIKKVKS